MREKNKDLVAVKSRKIGKNLINSVDARELHEFLGSKRDFSSWIKYRIEKYGFIEKIDFSPNLVKNRNRGRSRVDYILSIDMAKELCMIENTEKGKQARQYFIECERKVLEREREKVRKLSNHVPKPEINPLEALRRENKDLRTHLENYIYLFNTLRKMYETCRDDMDSYREESYKYRRKWLEDRGR
ncbi:MAG: antA/AntB antirepressor family protein [Desulfobacteraceae bacterium]